MALAQGAVAASFGAANSDMKASFSSLDGGDITGYASSVPSGSGSRPAVLLALKNAKGKDLCLSSLQKVPLVGAMSIQVHSGQQEPVAIDGMVANASELITPDGTLTNAQLGRDASTLDQNNLLKGPPGVFGLQASGLRATNVHLSAATVNASTLRLTGLSIKVLPGDHQCY
ncbi:DUF6230 family protein [Fodinicola feengrottensis]|uniref:DUF6230 family protein n=1 Tax=Fodinicola feengrottensis TaxID=435914 RepID=UPI0013D61C22|nr:DUF6230 family protein [Fodinicola feengrottensis]